MTSPFLLRAHPLACRPQVLIMSIIVMTDDDFEKNMQRLADQFHPLLAASFRARDTAQREALARLQAEMPDLRANMMKALDLLQVLTSTKYTDRAFVEAVDEADEMLEQLRGKVVLKGLADQQEAQGAAHGDEPVYQPKDEAISEIQMAIAASPDCRAHGLTWDEATALYDAGYRKFAPPAAAHGDEAVRKDAERYRFLKSDVNPSLMRELDFHYLANEWDTHIDAAMRVHGDGGTDHA